MIAFADPARAHDATYVLGKSNGRRTIECLVCRDESPDHGGASKDQEDVHHLYCGRHHDWHQRIAP